MPDYVLLSDEIEEFREISDFITLNSDSRLIITGNSSNKDILPGAACTGCADTIQGFQEIVQAIDRIEPAEKNDARQYRFLKQEVISFYSVQGGTGRTSITFNMAKRFNSRDMGKVLVIDLNFCEGPSDMHLALGMKKPRSLDHFAEDVLAGDEDVWKDISSLGGIDVLCPPVSLYRGEKFSIDMLADLVYSARNEYDLIVADLPFRYDNISLEMINISTTSVLVMSQDISMIQRIKAFNKFLPGRQKKLAVLNRAYGPNRLTADELEDMTGITLCEKIPFVCETQRKHLVSGGKSAGIIDLQDSMDGLISRVF
jgi:MinD-like ATPase involved in chromosome partitioning or flagellar assembly